MTCCWSSIGYLFLNGIGDLGKQHPGRLGVRHHQLRLVDRHRPRGHADLGDPAAAPAEVANVDQPLRRGDDAVRGRVRADVSAAAHRPPVAGRYWLLPYPNTMGIWPQFRSPLIWDVFAVCTYATVSLLFWYVGLIPDLATLRDRAKNKVMRLIVYGIARDGLARFGAALAPLRDRLPAAGRACRRRWCSRCTRSVSFDFAVGISPRLAHDDLPAVLRRGRDLSPASRWC